MKYITINSVLLLLYFISTINQVQCTCVLESDFGFSINCNFKKAGLFRVRNLGGVKAHFGLGFSVGDELGFPESLGNVEGSKRRALNYRTGANTIGVLPAAQMPSSQPAPKIQRSQPQAITSPNQMYQMQTMIQRPVVMQPQGFRRQLPQQQQQPAQMTQASSLPLGVPAFKPLKPLPKDTVQVKENFSPMQNVPQRNYHGHNTRQVSGASTRLMPSPAGGNLQLSSNVQPTYQIPPFSAMPTSQSRISLGPVYQVANDFSQPNLQPYAQNFETDEFPEIDLKGHTVEELAAAANVTVDVIRAAIKMRQQQMMQEKRYASKLKQTVGNYVTTQTTPATEKITSVRTTQPTTPRTTTPSVPKTKVSKYRMAGGHKVMNAPKEYYPVGYDKNFDDNFKSKVDLPSTAFHCGDQKHFPGLYADQDLGCMVFHVCALTDDGLIMKSFLCPESTLFDQTILKCNWWFYTDCKSSKSLYDSNLPVSKSYQLMKSLAFFNTNYKKPANGTADSSNSGIDVEALRNSVNDRGNL